MTRRERTAAFAALEARQQEIVKLQSGLHSELTQLCHRGGMVPITAIPLIRTSHETCASVCKMAEALEKADRSPVVSVPEEYESSPL